MSLYTVLQDEYVDYGQAMSDMWRAIDAKVILQIEQVIIPQLKNKFDNAEYDIENHKLTLSSTTNATSVDVSFDDIAEIGDNKVDDCEFDEDSRTLSLKANGEVVATCVITSGGGGGYTAGVGIDITDNVISANAYYAVYGTTTYTEAYTQLQAGKMVYTVYGGREFIVGTSSTSRITFTTTKGDKTLVYIILSSDTDLETNGWGTPVESSMVYTASSGIDITNNAVAAKVDGTTITTNSEGQLTLALPVITDTDPY